MKAERTEAMPERHFPARAEELAGTREFVRARALAAGCDAETADDVVLAVDEACQNVIRHAYGGECDARIELRIERQGKDLVILLRDYAPEVDRHCLLMGRDLDDVRPGGLGTNLIRAIMDEASFLDPPVGRGNLLRMLKRID